MNRYSMIFALLVASSFAVHPTPAGNGTSPAGGATDTEKNKQHHGAPAAVGNQLLVEDPNAFIQRFLEKAPYAAKATQTVQVLFATVPHPVETHLAAAFDHNVDALEDGLRDAGYLFDSSLIPWRTHSTRDDFDDDVKEMNAKNLEDETPGILLFRRNHLGANAYAEGMVVFLISEKPTQGISYSQVKTAWTIIGKENLKLQDPIRILGPTFSGSFASLVSMVGFFRANKLNLPFRIRSGGITLGRSADEAVADIVKLWPGTKVDFGSAMHDNADWIAGAVSAFGRIGIDEDSTAILSEGESLYGEAQSKSGDTPDGGQEGAAEQASNGVWRIGYPRDISSLRAGYESQGIFDSSSPMQAWKRALTLKNDTQGEGDSVQSFGGEETVAAQESVLFGIADFLKTHGIRAVIISATNEEDSYFLTQFLHSRDSHVRVAVIGSSRLFMRVSTMQFRGDLVVDSFPMLPRLHDWTDTQNQHSGHVFADDVAQGVYFAALDLFAEHIDSYAEYSPPDWDPNAAPEHWPPMYVAAMGSDSTWPVGEAPGIQFYCAHAGPSTVGMPFTLLGYKPQPPQIPPESAKECAAQSSPPHAAPPAQPSPPHAAPPAQPSPPHPPQSWQLLHVGTDWVYLLVVLIASTILYCCCFWYANPVSRVALASFSPTPGWRFWLFKVAIPGLVAGGAFQVMACAVAMPAIAVQHGVGWWYCAEAFTYIAPALIAYSALRKARGAANVPWTNPMFLSIVPLEIAILGFGISGFFTGDPAKGDPVGAVLNIYREMHWESGLSLVPTGMFLLVAIGVWASQAASGAAVLRYRPPLPHLAWNARISQAAGDAVLDLGLPVPTFRVAKWLWIVWGSLAVSILAAHFCFAPFAKITSLEPAAVTRLVMLGSGTIVLLMFLDLFHFLWLWEGLRSLLHALNLEPFRRSFVPIDDFKWTNLWSFNGSSFRDRRAINAAQIECVDDLARKYGDTAVGGVPLKTYFLPASTWLQERRIRYNLADLDQVDRAEFALDSQKLIATISEVGSTAAVLAAAQRFAVPAAEVLPDTEAIQRALVSQAAAGGGRFSDEAEELARLPEWQQTAEKLLCLIYIGFIQTVIARLHTLLASVALLFSLVTLGMAIYPFVPFLPLMVSGFLMLACIAGSFFRVFSQMDTDPILSRIVNGDDRKLQGNFYLKFGEAMALPLLTLGSSLLPGGSGRLLDIVTSLFSHGAQ